MHITYPRAVPVPGVSSPFPHHRSPSPLLVPNLADSALSLSRWSQQPTSNQHLPSTSPGSTINCQTPQPILLHSSKSYPSQYQQQHRTAPVVISKSSGFLTRPVSPSTTSLAPQLPPRSCTPSCHYIPSADSGTYSHIHHHQFTPAHNQEPNPGTSLLARVRRRFKRALSLT